ncbi:hypothetical protein [Brevibacterium spongiae]|uniref:Uncharacterized protein n=1 Tax=Brevibacterium spongiae TaxID=2909672 RepID=A0ABY5SLD6_9MICO|nr:hypothetical protein [Brevibacterium spongiae]UVI34985.1 hypothetical protein L1F31_12750 [Brevibacterium spongiae]
MTVAGEEFFALPVPMLGTGHLTLETHTLSIDTVGPVYCPAANVDFDLGDGCDAAAFSRVRDSGAANNGDAANNGEAADNGDAAEDGTKVVWRKSYTDSREVIAFDPPAGMTASPVHAYERQG